MIYVKEKAYSEVHTPRYFQNHLQIVVKEGMKEKGKKKR